MDERLRVEPDSAFLIPLVVDVDPVLQLGAGFDGACRAGRFQVDGVQALLGETGFLGQRRKQLLYHSAGTPARLSAQGERAAVRWRVATLVAEVCWGGGLAHSGAAVCGGAQRVAAYAVLACTEAGAGHRGGGGFADRAAGPLQAAWRHPVGAHQGGEKLAGVVRQVHVYGCGGDDARRIGDAHICKSHTDRAPNDHAAAWIEETK